MGNKRKDAAPRTIGGYEVAGELGSGGMGVVQLARQPALERPCVLKALHRELASDPRCAERFRREARAAAAVQHANVVAVYDAFTWRGTAYIAQEYVEGTDLARVLADLGCIAPKPAARGIISSRCIRMLLRIFSNFRCCGLADTTLCHQCRTRHQHSLYDIRNIS